MSATLKRQSVGTILAALQAALTAATWTPEGGVPEAAFQTVKLYDLADLEKAFTELLENNQRVCFIVADSESFTNMTGGNQILLTRKLPVALLISDRVHGSRITALYGGMNGTTPVLGAEGLKEIALEAVTGQLIENPAGVVCQPTSSAVVHIEDLKKKMPGRTCVELDVLCTGGTVAAMISPGPNL